MKALKITLYLFAIVNCSQGAYLRDLTGNECANEPYGAHIPYPGDCTKYLVCQWFAGTVMNCPDGLHFNPTTGNCDWPTQAGCTQGNSSPTTTTPTPTTTTPFSPTGSTPTLEPGNDICLNQPDDELFPYPYDCAWYIKCIENTALVLRCEYGWLFNPLLLICDYPENVDCTALPYPTTVSSSSSTTTPEPSESSSTTPTDDSSSSSTTTPEPSEETPSTTPSGDSTSSTTFEPETIPTLGPDEDVCVDQPNDELLPYPWDCAWYIKCEDNIAVVRRCEDGWLFNPHLLICDYPESAGCIPVPYPTTPPSTLPTPQTPSTTPEAAATTTSPFTLPTPQTPSTTESTTPEAAATTTSPFTLPTPQTPSTTESTTPEAAATTTSPFTLPTPQTPSTTESTTPEAAATTTSPFTLPTPQTPSTTENTTPETTTTTTSPATLPTPQTPPSSTESETESTWETTTQTSANPETSPTPGPVEGICINQPDGTLFPYPWDCAWFIQCKDNYPEIIQCENGWVFNAVLLICDYPYNAKCVATPYPTTSTPSLSTTPSSSSTGPMPTLPPGNDVCADEKNGTLLPYPWDCAWYIRCEETTPIIELCPNGWFFNQILQICDYPENTNCIASPYPTTSTATSIEPSSPLTPEPTGSTPPPYIGTGVCRNHELGTLLPYPGKCSLYIVCEEPAPIAIACDPGLEFNAELKICQPPEEAGCSIIKTTTELTTTTDSPSTPSQGVGICADRPIGDLIPYPGNCSQYIRCELPAPIALECLDGLEFNAVLQLCESAEDAGCSSTTGTTTIIPETSTTPIPDTGMTGICRGHEEGDLIPYPGNCNKYIICENPIPIAQKCGADLQFNPVLGICDEPDSAGCSDVGSSTTTQPETTTQSPDEPGMSGVCKGHQEGDLIPYPDSCTKYIRCEIPVPIAQKCKAGLHFNQALGICDTVESAGCPGYSTTTANPIEGTTTSSPTTTPRPPSMTGLCRDQEPGDLVPYPGNCSKYILCEIPVPIAIACKDDLHFNAELQICDDPVAAGCEPIPSTPIPITTPLPEANNVCCGQPADALIPYPEDCTRYILCAYPVPEVFYCDCQLHFNPVTKKCDAIESANCEWYTTTTTTTTTTTPAPPTCVGQPDETTFPYEGDCKKYNYCVNGEAIVLPCIGGTIYNWDAGKCVPGNVCPN